MLRRLITEDIRLRLHGASDLDAVRADEGQIEQVVVNLVVNARDAMPGGGEVTIETRNVVLDEAYVATHPEARSGPYAMLVDSDTGCGMDAETLERVFEPFFTTKPVGKGTGLGLSTVYGIVRQSGGSISVQSAPGRGAKCRIPGRPADAPPEAPASEEAQADSRRTTAVRPGSSQSAWPNT
jgi:signal transduction histidine kinase